MTHMELVVILFIELWKKKNNNNNNNLTWLALDGYYWPQSAPWNSDDEKVHVSQKNKMLL